MTFEMLNKLTKNSVEVSNNVSCGNYKVDSSDCGNYKVESSADCGNY